MSLARISFLSLALFVCSFAGHASAAQPRPASPTVASPEELSLRVCRNPRGDKDRRACTRNGKRPARVLVAAAPR